MKIEIRDTVSFKDLEDGSVFRAYDEIFIKIPTICIADRNCTNAINLVNGENDYFMMQDKVTPLKAKVVIE